MAQDIQLKQWSESLMFTKIFKTFQMAIHPSKMLIAFAAAASLCLLGLIMDIKKTVIMAPSVTASETAQAPMDDRVLTSFPTELHCYITAPEYMKDFKLRYGDSSQRLGVFAVFSYFCVSRFNDAVFSLLVLNMRDFVVNVAMIIEAIAWVFSEHPIYGLVFLTVALIVISFSGGAICRIAALQFANNEKPGMLEALRFAKSKVTGFVAAPLAVAAIVGLLGAPIFLLGLFGNFPYAGELLVGIFLIFALFFGFLITLLLIGTIGGFNLMYPTIAYEGSDSFDAISRSYSYIRERPWKMAFYTATAAVYGAACYIFVWVFTYILLGVTYGFLRLVFWARSSKVSSIYKLKAIWPADSVCNVLGLPRSEAFLNWSETTAAFLISIVILIVFCLAAAFVISFYFSANTVIYALMRNQVDNTAIATVYIQPDDRDAKLASQTAMSDNTDSE